MTDVQKKYYDILLLWKWKKWRENFAMVLGMERR